MKLTATSDPERALEQEREEHRQTGVALEQALARREELADDQTAYERNERTIAGLRSELQRRELVVAKRDADVAETKRRAVHADWHRAEDALRGTYEQRRKASKTVTGHLTRLLGALSELEAKRAAVEQAEAKFKALVPEDVDEYELPVGRDEPEWPEVPKDLLKVIASGPRKPEADLAAWRVKHERERAHAEHSQIRSAVQEMLQGFTANALRKTSEHLHEQVWSGYVTALEKRLAAEGLNEQGRALIEAKLEAARARRVPTDKEIKRVRQSDRWERVR